MADQGGKFRHSALHRTMTTWTESDGSYVGDEAGAAEREPAREYVGFSLGIGGRWDEVCGLGLLSISSDFEELKAARVGSALSVEEPPPPSLSMVHTSSAQFSSVGFPILAIISCLPSPAVVLFLF